MLALKGLFMEKWMCWGSMGVAGLLLLLFLLDMFLGVPFGGVSIVVDIVAVLACGIVLYLAYDALRDLRVSFPLPTRSASEVWTSLLALRVSVSHR